MVRQVKYLNNVVESDHGKLKLLRRPVRGFKTLKTAYATIKGFEVMRAYSMRCRSVIPREAGHPFHGIPVTHSTRCRSAIPRHPGHF